MSVKIVHKHKTLTEFLDTNRSSLNIADSFHFIHVLTIVLSCMCFHINIFFVETVLIKHFSLNEYEISIYRNKSIGTSAETIFDYHRNHCNYIKSVLCR